MIFSEIYQIETRISSPDQGSKSGLFFSERSGVRSELRKNPWSGAVLERFFSFRFFRNFYINFVKNDQIFDLRLTLSIPVLILKHFYNYNKINLSI